MSIDNGILNLFCGLMVMFYTWNGFRHRLSFYLRGDSARFASQFVLRASPICIILRRIVSYVLITTKQ